MGVQEEEDQEDKEGGEEESFFLNILPGSRASCSATNTDSKSEQSAARGRRSHDIMANRPADRKEVTICCCGQSSLSDRLLQLCFAEVRQRNITRTTSHDVI